ncbi:MAG TPA: hypothetical protein VKU19_18805 [Bryobacteraceae bacterium]|nr:hypothetical protein [Bryobacteraceae bacterium]
MMHTTGEEQARDQMSDEELIERIAVVNPVWARLMRTNPTVFERQPVPFYHRFQLLSATVSLEDRDMEFHYADDGSRISILRATPDYVYAVNQQESLRLDAKDIPAYLRFFFDNVTEPQITIVESTDEVPWISRVGSDPALQALKEQASAKIQPMRVAVSGADRFQVAATAMTGADLKELELTVQRDGRVDVTNERVVVEDLPVIESFS